MDYVSGGGKFRSLVHVNGKIYFTPSNEDKIGVFDIDTNNFSTISLERNIQGDCKYSASVVVDRKIYFTPCNASAIGVLDIDTNKFTTIDIGEEIGKTSKFD